MVLRFRFVLMSGVILSLISLNIYAVDEVLVKFNNIYMRQGDGDFPVVDLAQKNFTGSVLNALKATLPNKDCKKMKEVLESISSKDIIFKTGKCHDARKIALNTLFSGASNWGFSVSAKVQKQLTVGENDLVINKYTFKGKKIVNNIRDCAKYLEMYSKMAVPSQQLLRVDQQGNPLFTHEVKIYGSCSIQDKGNVLLEIKPVVLVK